MQIEQRLTLDRTADGFAALGIGVKTKTVTGVALPVGARYLSAYVAPDNFVGFDDATHGTFRVQLGFVAAGDVMDTVDVAAGTTPVTTALAGTGANGGFGSPDYPIDARTPSLLLTSSVDLKTCTVGHVEVVLVYTRIP